MHYSTHGPPFAPEESLIIPSTPDTSADIFFIPFPRSNNKNFIDLNYTKLLRRENEKRHRKWKESTLKSMI